MGVCDTVQVTERNDNVQLLNSFDVEGKITTERRGKDGDELDKKDNSERSWHVNNGGGAKTERQKQQEKHQDRNEDENQQCAKDEDETMHPQNSNSSRATLEMNRIQSLDIMAKEGRFNSPVEEPPKHFNCDGEQKDDR